MRNHKKAILIVFMLAVIAASGYLFYTNTGKASAATTTAQTATVTRGNLSATVASAGPVASAAQSALTFGTSGTVKQIYVKLGDTVKQGQVLAELDATELQFSMANAQLSFNQQQMAFDEVKAGPSASDLAAAQSSVDTAQSNYDTAVRKAGLNDQQLLIYRNTLDKAALSLQKTQSEYDIAVGNRVTDLGALSASLQQAKLDYASAQASYNIQVANIDDSAVRSAASALSAAKSALLTLQSTPSAQELAKAQAQLDQAALSLQQVKYTMRNAQLAAPFDGTVTALNLVAGTTAAASSTAIQLTDLTKLQLTVNMAEVDVSKIKTGQNVNLTFDALSDSTPQAGKVTQIALVGTTTSGVVNYPVVISLTSGAAAGVRVGMTANVSIVVEQRTGVLLVPNRAIKTVNRQKVVQVQTATGTLSQVVTIGLANDSQSEVLTGLNEGDKVLLGTTTAAAVGTNPGAAGALGIPGAGGAGR